MYTNSQMPFGSAIDGTWFNDNQNIYIIESSDTIIIVYKFIGNKEELFLNGISSGLTRWYTMFDSLYLKKTN